MSIRNSDRFSGRNKLRRFSDYTSEKFFQLVDFLNGPFTRWQALSVLFVLFSLVYTFFHFVNSSNQHDHEITLGIMFTFIIAIVGVLIWTKQWTWRTMAILMIFLADVGLYGYLAEGSRLDDNHKIIALRALRSAFTVGCNVMILVLLSAWRHEIQNRYEEDAEA